MSGARRLGTGLCGLLATLCLIALVLATPAGAVVSSTPSPSAWVTNGRVNALAQNGSQLFLGGQFNFVGPDTGPAAVLDTSKNGYGAGATSLVPGFPHANGAILAEQPDGTGGFFVGGNFTSIGGVAQKYLAHVTSSNHVDTTFKPSLNGQVDALANDGTRLFAGGSFSDGVTALNKTTGAVDPGWSGHSTEVGIDGTVAALAVSGGTLYVGGQFIFALNGNGNSTSVTNLVGLNASTGVPTSFHPTMDTSGDGVLALATTTVSTTPELLVGGDFATPSKDLADYNLSTSSPVTLNAYPDDVVRAIATDSTGDAWMGGDFANVGTNARTRLAKYELPNLDTEWTPTADDVVRALAIQGGNLILGGDFSTVTTPGIIVTSSGPRAHLASIGNSVATVGPFHFVGLNPWNPGTGAPVFALATEGANDVLAGGTFSSADGLTRKNLAALNLPTSNGDTGFTADTDATVWALAANGSSLFAGGSFGTVNGTNSPRLAKLDGSSGALDGTFASPLSTGDGIVEALVLSSDGSKLYAGGISIGVANNLGAFNSSTGAFEAGQAPAADDAVVRLLRNGNTVYAAGHFTHLGGLARTEVGSFSTTNGAVNASFNPSIGGFAQGVTALALSGSQLFLGGRFLTVGGASHIDLASVNSSTGAVNSGWHGDVDGGVTGLAVLGNHLYAAGGFTQASPTAQRFGVAAFNLNNGGLSPDFRPQLQLGPFGGDAPASSFAPGHVVLPVGNTLWLGDTGEQIDGVLRQGLAEFGFVTPHAAAPAPTVQGSPWPSQRLACKIGGFTGGPESYSFAWLRDGHIISGASAQTYTVRSGDLGHKLACRVTGVNPAGSGSETSSARKITHRSGGPKVKISHSGRASKQRVVTIKVTCPRGFSLCAGKLTLKTRGKHPSSVGSGSFKLHGARTAKLHITLSKSVFSQLKKKGSLTFAASATAHDASQRYGTASVTFKALAPKKH